MWNKVKKIICKQPVNTSYISSDPIREEIQDCSQPSQSNSKSITSVPFQCSISNMELGQMPLARAIFNIRRDYGDDFVRSKAIINALGDYKAFDDCPPARAIVKLLYSEGIYFSFIDLPVTSNWINEIERVSNRLSNQFGYKQVIVNHVLANILLGFGKCPYSDVLSLLITTNSETESRKQEEPEENSPIPQKRDKYKKQPNAINILPSVTILRTNGLSIPESESLKSVGNRLEWVLNGYGIDGKISHVVSGPRCSLFEIQVEPKKLAKLTRNEKDILISLGNRGCRVINPLHNKLAVGIEIPNPIDEINVMPGDIFNSSEFKTSNMALPIAIGIDATSTVICEDLAELGNLLLCGGLGQGKTLLVYQIISSLLFKVSPDDIKFIVAHSNQLELQELNKLPSVYFAHTIGGNVLISERADLHQTFVCLTEELEQRTKFFQLAGTHNIEEYNKLFVNGSLNPADGHHYLPRLVCIVDEVQPFFNGKEWDDTLSPMFEKTRAVGVHFIFTTRYTSAESLTPLIRNYLPNKICFRINLPNESRLAIGRTDATNLLDKGDVLVVKNDEIIRCQTSNFEISYFEIIVNEINKRTCSGGDYILPEKELFDTFAPTGLPVFDKDPLFDEVARLIVTSKTASTSIVQRRYNIGYNRAGKIMDQLEAAGIVGPSNGGKPRSVLVNSIMLESILNS